jgi:hypothetical protein
MLTVIDVITSSGKYPERVDSHDLTADVLANGAALVRKVNALLADLKAFHGLAVDLDSIEVSSGFRPPKINEETPGASKRSLHITLNAVDLHDPGNQIGQCIEKAPWLLIEHDLWNENPRYTPGWCHLDQGDRKKRLVRIFNP